MAYLRLSSSRVYGNISMICLISTNLFLAIHIEIVDLPKKVGLKKQLEVDINRLLDLIGYKGYPRHNIQINMKSW